MSERKHGNNECWCFLPEVWDGREIGIWKCNSVIDSPELIARAKDKYEAKLIVDAIIGYNNNIKNKSIFGKKELSFLEFVCTNCVEPYATMASNAILWNDKEVYESLKSKFSTYY